MEHAQYDTSYCPQCHDNYSFYAFTHAGGFPTSLNVRGPTGTLNAPIIGLNCTGSEQTISECTHYESPIQSPFAAVQCIGKNNVIWSSYTEIQREHYDLERVQCLDGEMRLVSSSRETEDVREGRLEICYQGVWGAVYDPAWTAIDAALTCQQLGFDPRGTYTNQCIVHFIQAPHDIGALPLISAVFPSDGRALPIVYDSPTCNGSSSSLLACLRSGRDQLVGELGRLVNQELGSQALTFVVGVSCEGILIEDN